MGLKPTKEGTTLEQGFQNLKLCRRVGRIGKITRTTYFFHFSSSQKNSMRLKKKIGQEKRLDIASNTNMGGEENQ